MQRALIVMPGLVARGEAARALSHELSVDEAPSVAAARELLDRGRYCRALIDLDVRDGDGLELLDEMRRRGLRFPVLLVASVIDRLRSERAHLLGAPLVGKPLAGATLAVLARPHRGRSPASMARAFAEQFALTPRQTEVLLALARRTRPSELHAVLRVSRGTTKKLVHQILVRSGAASLDEVLTDLLVAADRASDTG